MLGARDPFCRRARHDVHRVGGVAVLAAGGIRGGCARSGAARGEGGSVNAIDLFCGAGGTSTGAVLAGAKILAAVNHWPRAVATHQANHPATLHLCEDAAIVDPTTLPAHDLLLASPSCTGHTRARGTDRPHHDAARATAWCVIRVAEAQRPRVIAVENVPEMLRWTLYRAWRMALTDLGYRVSEQVLDAADCGTPQERQRLIIVASRTRRPIFVAPGQEPRIAARSCLDLDGGSWTQTAQWCERSRARIARAQEQHGSDVLVPYYGSSTGGRSLDRPIGTLTTVDRYALVRGDRGRMLSVDEMRRLSGFPDGYVLTGTKREQTAQLGNAVPPPLARHVVRSIMEAV